MFIYSYIRMSLKFIIIAFIAKSAMKLKNYTKSKTFENEVFDLQSATSPAHILN